nr:hypothetical protein [Tanacetum cinerariifolium]
MCPLTRISTPTIVPPREPIPIVTSTDKLVVTLVYSRKTKAKKVPNIMEPNNSWGSSSFNVPSSPIACRLSKLSSVKFGNVHVAKIMGYGDYQIGNVTISRVRLKVPVCRIRTDNGTEFVNQTLRDYYEEVGISHETSVARSPQQNRVVERRNRTLIEAARTMLIYAQAPLFLWAEVVATACFTQNRSIIRLRHGKTPYELLHSTKKAFRIYNRRTRRIVETIHVDFDELTAMASEHRSLGPALNEMTPGTISSGLVPTTSTSTSYVRPLRNDWDLLFQPMFDELLNPPPSVVNQAPEAIAPIAEVIPPFNADSTSSPSSTTVEQDAPSTSNSPT